MPVAFAHRIAPHDNADQSFSVAFGRSDDMVPGRVDITGFQTVAAFVIPGDQIVIAVIPSAVTEPRTENNL